jgi:drug/metabolite transporter (DMT)-like permease
MRRIDALPPQTRHWVGVALLAFGNVGFSAKAVIIKLAYRHDVDSYSLLSLRMVFSIPFYILTALYLSRRSANVQLTRRQWAYTALLGVIGYYGASLLDFLGLQYISASMERLILYTYPTMVLVMSVLLFKKKIAAAQYWALLLTYAGVLFAFSAEAAAGVQRDLFTGGLFVFACAFLYAIYVVFAGEM